MAIPETDNVLYAAAGHGYRARVHTAGPLLRRVPDRLRAHVFCSPGTNDQSIR